MSRPYTITHRGVPVGTVELPPSGERIAVAVTTLSGYEAIRPLVRRASRALSAIVLGAPVGPGPRPLASETALGHAAELGRALELRDSAGALVPTDFIDLTDWPGGAPEVAAMIGLRDSHAREPAPAPAPPVSDSESESPAG
jgi:hypothetical protein